MDAEMKRLMNERFCLLLWNWIVIIIFTIAAIMQGSSKPFFLGLVVVWFAWGKLKPRPSRELMAWLEKTGK